MIRHLKIFIFIFIDHVFIIIYLLMLIMSCRDSFQNDSRFKSVPTALHFWHLTLFSEIKIIRKQTNYRIQQCLLNGNTISVCCYCLDIMPISRSSPSKGQRQEKRYSCGTLELNMFVIFTLKKQKETIS